MTSVFSWQNSISLCPASFCTPRPNLPVIPVVSWLPTFASYLTYTQNTLREMLGWNKHKLESTLPAATAKSLQLCLTLCDPIDDSPLGSPIPGILQARTLEWVATSFSNTWKWKVKVKSFSRVWLLVTPMDCSLPGSSVHGIFQARVLEWGAIAFSKIARRNISNLRYKWHLPMAENEEELKSLLMKVKEESEIAGLKLNIQKTKIMASSPITSWQVDGETMETVRDFILGDFKITADGDWNHEIKRCLLLGRKTRTNLGSILKSRNITLPTKVHLVKAMVFPVVVYGCESWTIKKAECWRIDAFELWCWRRLLRVPWTARWFNQSILKETSPEYLLEGLILKLKLWYLATWCEELSHWKRPWCWERLKAGGEGDDRG